MNEFKIYVFNFCMPNALTNAVQASKIEAVEAVEVNSYMEIVGGVHLELCMGPSIDSCLFKK